jgi:adenylate cyclase
MFEWIGIPGRLLFAFFGISALAVLATAAALYGFLLVGDVIDRITKHRVPSVLVSMQLSRQAERVAAAAPALLAATNKAQHDNLSTAVAGDMARLEELLPALKGTAIRSAPVAGIEAAVLGPRRNLKDLDDLVHARLGVAARKEELLRRLSATSRASQRLANTGSRAMTSKLFQWRAARADSSMTPETATTATEDLAQAITAYIPQQKAQQEVSDLKDALLKAAVAPTASDLQLITASLRPTLEVLEPLASAIDQKLRNLYLSAFGAIHLLDTVSFRQRVEDSNP